VDGTESEDLATALDVKGYPTVMFVRRGGVPAEYDGDRSTNSLVTWAKQKASPKLDRLESADAVSSFVSKGPTVFVLYPGEADKELEEMMIGVAASTSLPCAVSSVAPAGVTAPALVAYKGSAAAPAAVLSGADGEPLQLRRMEKFAKVEALPLVVTYTESSEEQLFAADVPLHVLLFHDGVPPTAAMEGAARNLRGEAVFATVEATKFPDAARYFDADSSGSLSLPVAVGYSLTNGTKFITHDLGAEQLLSFVRSIQSGEQLAHIRSQPEPSEGLPGAPVELVGTTYSRVVMDDSKDVLVQYYTPSCGHCRKLAPVYASLAAKLADDADIVIAQIDGEANDVPGMVPEGFPTIIFFPKTNKRGVEYDGSRDEHDMLQFIADVRAGREHIGGLPGFADDGTGESWQKVEL